MDQFFSNKLSYNTILYLPQWNSVIRFRFSFKQPDKWNIFANIFRFCEDIRLCCNGFNQRTRTSLFVNEKKAKYLVTQSLLEGNFLFLKMFSASIKTSLKPFYKVFILDHLFLLPRLLNIFY